MVSEPIELTKFGEYLGTQLGISSFAGGILASILVTMLVLVPILFLGKGRNGLLMLLMAFSCTCFSVVVSWIPVWTLAVWVLLLAFLGAKKFRGMV